MPFVLYDQSWRAYRRRRERIEAERCGAEVVLDAYRKHPLLTLVALQQVSNALLRFASELEARGTPRDIAA